MFVGVLFRTATFPSTERLSKAYTQSKIFLHSLNISFAIIPNFTNIGRGKGNTIVNLPRNDNIMTFFKYWKVKTIVRNYIQVITKYKITARKWIVYSMSRLADYLFMSCWWCESIKWTPICIGNIIIAQFWASSFKLSNKNGESRKFIVYMIHKSI